MRPWQLLWRVEALLLAVLVGCNGDSGAGEGASLIVTRLMVLAMPEPVTKLVAAWGTAALIFWVGALTLYNLITGWFELMKEARTDLTRELRSLADEATTPGFELNRLVPQGKRS